MDDAVLWIVVMTPVWFFVLRMLWWHDEEGPTP